MSSKERNESFAKEESSIDDLSDLSKDNIVIAEKDVCLEEEVSPIKQKGSQLYKNKTAGEEYNHGSKCLETASQSSRKSSADKHENFAYEQHGTPEKREIDPNLYISKQLDDLNDFIGKVDSSRMFGEDNEAGTFVFYHFLDVQTFYTDSCWYLQIN